MLLGEVLEPVVVEVTAEPDGAQDEDRPVIHPRSSLVGTSGPVDILGDGVEQFGAEFGAGIDVLECPEDGDDLVTAFGVEADIGDTRAVEPKLGIEGASHGSVPRRMSGSGPTIGGIQGILSPTAPIFEKQF
jgi:hypothetical protein